MAAQADLVALYKQYYADTIKDTYNNMGELRKLVTNGSETEGINKTYPLMGLQTTYQRFDGETIQPNQPVTSNVVMTFEQWEAAHSLSFVKQYDINNPDYIPALVRRQTNAIVSRVEQIIINAFNAAPVSDVNSLIPTNIDNGYRINGDGSAYTNAGAEQVVSIKGLLKVKEMFDDTGVVVSDRFLYLPSNALYGLMTGPDKAEFNSYDFSNAKNLSESGMVYNNLLGINIIVGQKNPISGLPASGAGTYGFAFTRDTLLLNINDIAASANMWRDDNSQSWRFLASVRCGAVCVQPSTLIKIACKTA